MSSRTTAKGAPLGIRDLIKFLFYDYNENQIKEITFMSSLPPPTYAKASADRQG